MHGSNQTSPSNRSAARFMAIAGVQLALLLALLYYYLPASKVSVVPSHAQAVALGAVRMLATDRTAIYHLYALDANGGADDNAVPGESQATGVVVDAWRADTDVNRRACLSLWLFDHAHEKFCKALRRTIVLAVRESGAVNGRIAYVPAPAEVRIATGDQVTFMRGKVGADNRTAALPVLSAGGQKPAATTKAF